ncbi:hypothetical protein LCGC14_2737100 [marine sediment metagenome]|uniref:Uncharacterized protein n=1 Tax=marine sediment metagenome TaxID=412755 RepID=A0A0F9BX82_9ZZZZ
MRTCSIQDCGSNYSAKGYCDKHYRKYLIYGDPLHFKKEQHGMCGTPEYTTWYCMKARCYNKNYKQYKDYGGRGIAICDRWRNSFIAFFEDMGLRPFPKARIDRIDNDGNYTPENCRWVTAAESSQNRSITKLTMQKANEIRKLYKTGGITQKAISFIYGVSQDSIWAIVNNKQWI